MAKKEETSKGKDKLQEALDKLDKAYGKGTVLSLDSKSTGVYDIISSGSLGFDWIALGVGGFVKGKLYEIMGWEACLAADTYIKFINVREDGVVQDCKGATIENLYKRFHNRTDKTRSSIFNVTSITENNRVFRNEIADVVKTGKKECFEIVTEKGFTLKCTKDHKFYTGTCYLPLEQLNVGDTVFIHNNTPFKAHIDENTLNNHISNLEMLDGSVHSQKHALLKQDNLRFMVIPDIIKSIVSVGEQETYDIKCYFPFNNYIANGIVVHNSGKSTICIHATAECQKAGGRVLYIDGEHAMDKHYFQALGVDTTSLLISQPMTGEEGFNIALEMIQTGKIDLVIIDSDSSLIPKAVVEGEVGDSAIGKKARLNNDAYPKIKNAASNNHTCVIVISQFREKIGVMFGCLHGDTLINFTDGRSIPIKDVVKNKIQGSVYTINTATNKIEEKQIIDWHYNGKVTTNEDYIHIETIGLNGQNTISVTITPDHQVLTSEGWKSAKKLTVSDQLVSKYTSKLNCSLGDFLYGCYVGDCSTEKRYKTTANISFQDKNNPEYLKWKIEKLSEHFKFSIYKDVYHSEFTSEFMLIKNKYPKRDINAFLDNYSDLGLAIWFMDDGHFDTKNGHCRYSLSIKRVKDDQKIQQIVNSLNIRLGITCSYKNGSLIFNKQDTLRIAEIIHTYIPPCMQYKLPEQFRNKYIDFSLKGNVELKTHPVQIKSIRYASNKEIHNKSRYDLSIEGNTNYFAGGILNGVVVHNSPTTTQGGHALKFYSDCRIEVSKSLAKDGDTNYGNKTKIKVTKNKMGPPYRGVEFDIVYGEGIDTIKEIVTLAEQYSIINKSGSWYSYNGTSLGQGETGVKAVFLDNPELYEEIKFKVINAIQGIEYQLAPDEKRLEETA